MSTFALNKLSGLPIKTVDNGDGTCTIITLLADNPSLTAATEIATFAMNKDAGLPLKTVDNGDGTCSLVIGLFEIGNVWWVRSQSSYTINENRENIATGTMTIDGRLIINGRNTVL